MREGGLPHGPSQLGWVIRILLDNNSVDVEGTNLKEGIRENTGVENKIKD